MWINLRWGTSLHEQGHRSPWGSRDRVKKLRWGLGLNDTHLNMHKRSVQIVVVAQGYRSQDTQLLIILSCAKVPWNTRHVPRYLVFSSFLNLSCAEISTYWFHLTQSTSYSHIIWAFCVLQTFFFFIFFFQIHSANIKVTPVLKNKHMHGTKFDSECFYGLWFELITHYYLLRILIRVTESEEILKTPTNDLVFKILVV